MDRLRWIKPIAGIHMIKLLRIAAWILTLAVIAHGLQACATKRPASQSKFDAPKYDLDRRHKR